MEPQKNQNSDQDTTQSQYFDPFPEPQTIPAGWDTSTLLSVPKTASVQDVDNKTDSGRVVSPR